MEKKKIMTISDHPLIPSGVGLQTRYVIEGLLKTGKYKVVSWGAAISHPDPRPQKIFPEIYGDDWTIHPIVGYGDREKMRMVILSEKPDILLIVTDPRFYTWLFEMADEIRQNMPIIYWHVWDNDPVPDYNRAFYESIDSMVPLSLKTHGLLQDLERRGLFKGSYEYIPHAIPPETYKILTEEEVTRLKRERLGVHRDKKFLVFWNNRNARRKMSGDVIAAFSKFARDIGKENTSLVMQTQARDPEGQDLIAVAKKFGIDDCLVLSESRLPSDDICGFYNMCDTTINIANNEGFGLGTLESMMCGTPIIVNMTGGLQFQIGDWWEGRKDFSDQDDMTKVAREKWKKKTGKWWGIPVFPAARSCTGSQPIPYIYDDRVSHEDVVDALKKLYSMTRAERRALGSQSREWAMKTFGMDSMVGKWDAAVERTIRDWKKPVVRFTTL